MHNTLSVSDVASRIRLAGDCVTDIDLDSLTADFISISGSETARIQRAGFKFFGSTDCTFLLQDEVEGAFFGTVLHNTGVGNTFIFGHPPASGLYATFRVFGAGCAVVMPYMASTPLNLNDVFMRSNEQLFFWGKNASSVGTRIEIHGEHRSVLVGDDCMFSSGVFIRNFDMHSIVDLADHQIINSPPIDVVIEAHVWVSQDALLLSTDRVGFGSIIGAKALAKGVITECVAVGGVPAKAIRSGVSWGRSELGLSPTENALLARLTATTEEKVSLR